MDSRFHLKAAFEIYGREFKADMSLNWSADEGQIDERVTEWFLQCHKIALNEWQAKNCDAQMEREATELKEREVSELRRLREKYPAA